MRPVPPEGARVEVLVAPGGPTRVRQSWRVRGYLSASEAVVRVGLGPGAVSADVRVVWPGGGVTLHKALAAGRVHRVSDKRLPP